MDLFTFLDKNMMIIVLIICIIVGGSVARAYFTSRSRAMDDKRAGSCKREPHPD